MKDYDESQLGMSRLILIMFFFGFAYMLYTLAVSIYENYRIEQHIANFQEKNTELQIENQKKIEDLQYFSSPEYKEKIAKQSLRLINPGEEVIVIPDEALIILSQDEDMARLSEELRASWSNPKKWMKFFFSYNQFKV